MHSATDSIYRARGSSSSRSMGAGQPYLPDNFVHNTVVYTGTHDNATTREWYEDLPDDMRRNAWNYLKRPAGNSSEAAPALIELVWSSVAALAMAPLQDLLNLGNEARMNIPGRSEGNWSWRCTEEMLRSSAFEWLRSLTRQRASEPAA